MYVSRLRWGRVAVVCCFAAALLSGAGQSGQHTTAADNGAEYVPTLTFDVASIHETKPDVQRGFVVGMRFEPANSSHYSAENNTLFNLIEMAYPSETSHFEGLQKLSFNLQHATFNVQAKSDVPRFVLWHKMGPQARGFSG